MEEYLRREWYVADKDERMAVRAILDRDLVILKDDTLRMGGLLESAIAQSMHGIPIFLP